MVTLRTVPWILLLGGLGWLALTSVAAGHGLLVVVTPVWLLAVGLERALAGRLDGKGHRITADIVLGLICVLLLPFGGLWVLPGVVAFGLLDLAGAPSPGPRRPYPPRVEIALAGMTALATVASLGVVLYSPLYSTSMTSISSTGVVTETQGTATLAQVGFPLPLVLAILGLGLAVLLGAVVDVRGLPFGRPLIGIATAGLALLAILGGFSIGMFLVPAGFLSALTFVGARGGPDRARA